MLYVVTAVHNRYSITETFVKQLKAQTYKDIKLVLVDDGSTDGTAEMVKNIIPDAVIICGNGNLWWGGALHMAYKWLKVNANPESYVMLANDDTIFPKDYIERALRILKEKQNTILTGAGISKQTGKLVDGAVNFDFLKGASTIIESEPYLGNCASTRSTFIQVGYLFKTGGLHPILLPHYGSDYEWMIRACRKCQIKSYCDMTLKYEVNEATTGDHTQKNRTLKQIMNKRSASNPIYKITFCLLSSPWGLKFASVLAMLMRVAIRKN